MARITSACMDLLSGFAVCPQFDVIFANLPKHNKQPRDLADRGWHSRPTHRGIANVADNGFTYPIRKLRRALLRACRYELRSRLAPKPNRVVRCGADGTSQGRTKCVCDLVGLYDLLQVRRICFGPTSKQHDRAGQLPPHAADCVPHRSCARIVEVGKADQRDPFGLEPEHIRTGHSFCALYTSGEPVFPEQLSQDRCNRLIKRSSPGYA